MTISKRNLVLLLFCTLLVLTGCQRGQQRYALKTVWLDFNIYDRPAVFFDEKSHLPAPSQHVRHHHWRHPPTHPGWGTVLADSAVRNVSGEVLPGEPIPMNGMLPPEPYPAESLPPAPVPPAWPAPAEPHRGSSSGSAQEWPAPSVPVVPPLPGPSADRTFRSTGAPPVQQAGWQNVKPQLPTSGTLFARP